MLETKLDEAEWLQARYEQMNFIDEKRLKALNHMQGDQRQIARYYNKKVVNRNINVGDTVIKKRLPHQSDPRGKFKPNYEGPLVVKEIFLGGAAILADMENGDLFEPINIDQLKKYYT